MNRKSTKITGLTRGLIVFAYLAVLTAVEYWVGVNALPTLLLWITGLLKAALVLWFFMHLGRVFAAEGEENDER